MDFSKISKAIAGFLATSISVLILKHTGIDLNVIGAGPELAAALEMAVAGLFGFGMTYFFPKNAA